MLLTSNFFYLLGLLPNLGQKFFSHAQYADTKNTIYAPYYHFYERDHRHVLIKSHNCQHFDYSDDNETFAQKFKICSKIDRCPCETCPFQFSVKLISNNEEPMQSYLIIDQLNLTHNHPSKLAQWLEFATFRDVQVEIEEKLTVDNINTIHEIIDKTCNIIQSSQQENEPKLTALYSFGCMQEDETVYKEHRGYWPTFESF